MFRPPEWSINWGRQDPAPQLRFGEEPVPGSSAGGQSLENDGIGDGMAQMFQMMNGAVCKLDRRPLLFGQCLL